MSYEIITDQTQSEELYQNTVTDLDLRADALFYKLQ